MRQFKCRLCQEFASVNYEVFLQHINRKHKCPFPQCVQKYHQNVGDTTQCEQGSSISGTNGCHLCSKSFTNVRQYVDHLSSKHRCKRCRLVTCKCNQNGPSPLKRRLVEYSSSSDSGDDDDANVTPSTSHHAPPNINVEENQEQDNISDDGICYQDLRDRFCGRCNIRFRNLQLFQAHIKFIHPEVLVYALQQEQEQEQIQIGRGEIMPIVMQNTMFEEALRTYKADLDCVEVLDVDGLFNSLRHNVKQIICETLTQGHNWKVQFSMEVSLYKEHPSGEIEHNYPIFNAFLLSVENNESSISFAYKKARETFKTRLEDYINLSSGWIMDKILGFEMTLTKYIPIRGGNNIELPKVLKKKYKCLVNVSANDGICFKRAVYCHKKLSGNIGGRNRFSRLQSTAYFRDKINDGRINWNGIKFPFNLKQVGKFEKQNPRVGLNIFLFDDENMDEQNEDIEQPVEEQTVENVEQVELESDFNNNDIIKTRHEIDKAISAEIRAKCYPVNICKEERPIIVDLLLVMTDVGSHFLYIENFAGLFRKPGHLKRDICRYCLQAFSDSLDIHVKYCAGLDRQKTNFPTKHKNLAFRKLEKTQFQPYTIFADFESNLHKINKVTGNTTQFQHHVPVGYAYVCIDWQGQITAFNKYRARRDDENVVQRFLTELIAMSEDLVKDIKQWNKEAKEIMLISEEDIARFYDPEFLVTEKCCYCNSSFREGENICRDHEHLPPFRFRGYACNSCNLNAKQTSNISCFFHNLKAYDGLFLIKNAIKDIVEDIDIIATSSEKIMSITVNKHLQFVDSLNFFHASLDKVVKSLNKETDFKLTREHFAEYGDKIDLLLQKQFYPYSYFDSVARFEETNLPDQIHFYNDLSQTPISNEDYEHAQTVWRELGINSLGEWYDLYVSLDVLLLADAFMSMRTVFYKDFGLDCCKYMSLPQLSFDAALKMTKAKLEYIVDPTMYCWLQSSIYGGISTSGNKRHYKANNKYLPDYDSSQPSSYIQYLDACNLYGKALTSKLPQKHFKWVVGEELLNIQAEKGQFITNVDVEGDHNYFYEVDLTIPESLHDYFNAYCPIPVKRSVENDELSATQRCLAESLNISNSSLKCERLICDFAPKPNYVVHGQLLALWIQLGVVVEHVHRAVSFYQSEFFKPYVDYNTEKRKHAVNELEVSMRKNANNMLYGKSLQNKRNLQNVKVVRNREEIIKWVSKPTAQRVIVINTSGDGLGDVALVCMKRLEVTLDSPVAVGSAVLAISKQVIQSFFYNYLMQKFPRDSLDLLASDTDSLMIGVKCEDIYEAFKEDENEFFDMSGYDSNHPIWSRYFNETNKKVPGMMKDEYANCIISEFLILKPKCYAMLYYKNNICNVTGETVYTIHDLKKGKSIPASAMEKQVKMDDFFKCITEPNYQSYTTSNSIRSYKHDLFTIQQHRKALNAFDLKRYILSDGINTLGYGHKDIPLYEALYEAQRAAAQVQISTSA